ncbi:2'-5' RNA ligase family protein [Methylobacterium gossipiicola]|uniref:2'-5' RNA ligase superfamily protein n=1 Tax=Methylobacterium gossipiicola TaxID=582675 RepID=A0A1I2VKK4_9HYPH|nr:2'-5' RNA ligase family protein [Methylobacterium gossipiicola]SFG88767.1 2'-5' RNA ligase superfamily protein [Methylobacterium gossipiicola]
MTNSDATPDPLILTLQFEAQTYAFFDDLRRRHFPAALNRIPAHVTLFHHLPGADAAGILETVAARARAEAPPLVSVTGLRFLGRGVAYTLESAGLSAFRGRLARDFAAVLTAQDAQGWRPHVTIQNKVAPGAARALLAEREAAFEPFAFTAPGLVLWRYLGGPWERRATVAFGENR